jgi:hypothetical protein
MLGSINFSNQQPTRMELSGSIKKDIEEILKPFICGAGSKNTEYRIRENIFYILKCYISDLVINENDIQISNPEHISAVVDKYEFTHKDGEYWGRYIPVLKFVNVKDYSEFNIYFSKKLRNKLIENGFDEYGIGD